MGGLAGIVVSGGEFAPPMNLLPQFEQMMASLAHRGGTDPDATWHGPGGLLGALTLSRATPERPLLEDPESGLILAWHGRLDNRLELLTELVEPGEQPGDAAIVLRAFKRWNENCVSKLIGDFAFALWDPRTRALFAARDALGLKPFFYSSGPGSFYFFSEVQALARLPGVSAEVNDETVGEFLLGWTDFPRIERTFYRQIERLPPAHWLRWSAGRLEIERYWRVDPARRLRFPRREDYVQEFGRLFTQAVACRLPSTMKVGVFLSAGLDSGAVCSIAAKVRPGGAGLRAYSISLEGTAALTKATGDESVYAARVAQELGIACDRVPLSRSADLGELSSRLSRHASPFFEEGWAHEENLLRRVAKDGLEVVLTGDGGDELFNDPGAYVADLVRSLRWAKLAVEIGARARYYQRTPLDALRRALPGVVPTWGIRAWRSWKPRALPSWIDPCFADRIGLSEQLREVRSKLPFSSLSADADHHALTRGRMTLMHEQREWAAAQHGIEYRFPFYDRRLIEFLLAIPYELKSEGGQPKSLLRKLPGISPLVLAANREKVDYGGRAESILREQLGEALGHLFQNPPPAAQMYVRTAQAQTLCQEFLAGADNQEKPVWILACFFLWIQHAVLGINKDGQGEGVTR
ncbi:MAG: hypothetical protein GZ088_07525 [Acidipila sp.]|nr:hypothetical protein [Acidipila sp.]